MSRRFGIINLYICSTLVTSFGSITAGDDFQGGEFNLGMRQLKQNDGPPNLEAKKTQQNNELTEEEKLARLDALELKIQHLETVLMEHQKQEDERNAELVAHQEQQSSVNNGTMPSSCSDLWQIGHTLSGLYSVMGSDQVETVHCNFAKHPDEQDFQTFIGYSDVKSSPVYFYAQRSSPQYHMGYSLVPIPFDPTILNVGGNMNASSGVFTAPQSGIYSFHLSGVGRYLPVTSSRFIVGPPNFSEMFIDLVLNGNQVGRSLTRTLSDRDSIHTFTLHSTLELNAGDQVWTTIYSSYHDAIIYDDVDHYTHFTGQLLQENVASLFNLTTISLS